MLSGNHRINESKTKDECGRQGGSLDIHLKVVGTPAAQQLPGISGFAFHKIPRFYNLDI